RVDEGDLIAPGQLHQGELGEVRALAVELGVQRVDVGLGDPSQQLRQSCIVLDEGWGGAQSGSGPVTTGSPWSMQAMTPPATFTAAIPCLRSHSPAALLRLPVAQMRSTSPVSGTSSTR